MRSNGVMVVVMLLLSVVLSCASPAPVPPSAPSSDASPFSISEYTVDNEGLWTDTEVPLSDASLEAIRHATPATPEDIEAWNAEAAPDMQVQAILAELDEEGAEPQADTDADADVDADTHAQPQADADAEPESAEQDISTPIHDNLEIAEGSHGRMLLIPRSSRLGMRRIVMLLKRLITQLKAQSPLARVTLRMKIEPVTIPTPTPSRRSPPALGIPHRPRPIAIRLIPSRSDMRTRRWLARCSMLLRAAVQRLRKMRQMMIRERMKQRRRAMSFRFPGRSIILFRSNNITTTGPAFSQTTLNRFEIEGGKNGTVTIIAPRINATLAHSIIVINRGTIILLNRSRNNTMTLTPPRTRFGDRRQFLLPLRRHHVMTANENTIEPEQHEA